MTSDRPLRHHPDQTGRAVPKDGHPGTSRQSQTSPSPSAPPAADSKPTREHSRPGDGDTSVPSEKPRRTPGLKQRRKQPVPASRAEADEAYKPWSPSRDATPARLGRLNGLGLLELRSTPGPSITQQQAHEATLDALYDEHGLLRDMPTTPTPSQPVHETVD